MLKKGLYLFGLWLALCSFSPYSEEKDNIELTEFTKALISFFINDSTAWEIQHGLVNPNKQDIVLDVLEDSTCYLLRIEARDKDFNWEELCFDCTITIMGITTYEGYRVYHLGEKNLLFTNAVTPFKQIKIKQDYPLIYDPYETFVPINKETLTFDLERFYPQRRSPYEKYLTDALRLLCEQYITPQKNR